MGTINYDMAKLVTNARQWGVRRVNHRDGSTTYYCKNCGQVIVHDEPGTIRLGLLPHVEGEKDDKEAGRCKAREAK